MNRCPYCGNKCRGDTCRTCLRLVRIEREMRGDVKLSRAGHYRRKTSGRRVTSHARVKCACGVFVYTEQIDQRPPVLPDNCWRCDAPLPRDQREAATPTKGKAS